MPEDAGIDIDYDAELARLQGQVAGVEQPPLAAEVVVAGGIVMSGRTVEFMGRNFRIAEKVGLMPMLKFSAHAEMRTDDPGAMAAMYEMIRDCIYAGNPGCGDCLFCDPDPCGECRACVSAQDGEDPACMRNFPDRTRCAEYDPGDWGEFERHAIDTKAEADDLLDVITKTIEVIAGRPTEPPAGSSPGRRSTRDASMARSSARGRPKGSRR
jgi:hypothetical protein